MCVMVCGKTMTRTGPDTDCSSIPYSFVKICRRNYKRNVFIFFLSRGRKVPGALGPTIRSGDPDAPWCRHQGRLAPGLAPQSPCRMGWGGVGLGGVGWGGVGWGGEGWGGVGWGGDKEATN